MDVLIQDQRRKNIPSLDLLEVGVSIELKVGLGSRSGQLLILSVDFERGARSPQSSTLLVLRMAIENAGVEFIPSNGGGPGVRLRKG